MEKIIIIPAYQPDERLLHLVEALIKEDVQKILLVDDGSSKKCSSIFNKAKKFKQIELISHKCNMGKGAALRSGFKHVLDNFPHCRTVITADADGQHTPADIQRVSKKTEDFPEDLVLGARQFSGYIPLRSRFGNSVTRILFNSLFGMTLQDTQTGLRGIPVVSLPFLMKLGGERYNFELEMLICMIRAGIRLTEVPILAIYEKNNATSHFRPLTDSFAIYSTMFSWWWKRSD